MSVEIWLAFAVASQILVMIPGPTVLLVVSYALSGGRISAWSTVPGVCLGDLTAMTVSLAGAGGLLAASATLFTILKLCGAGYLVWLGFRLWRADPDAPMFAQRRPGRPGRGMFWNAYIVTALNPKGIVFFIAFVPQFIDPTAPSLLQFAILEATFVGLATLNALIWALAAGELRRRLTTPGALRLINRLGAGFLVGAGALTALARRSL